MSPFVSQDPHHLDIAVCLAGAVKHQGPVCDILEKRAILGTDDVFFDHEDRRADVASKLTRAHSAHADLIIDYVQVVCLLCALAKSEPWHTRLVCRARPFAAPHAALGPVGMRPWHNEVLRLLIPGAELELTAFGELKPAFPGAAHTKAREVGAK